MWVAGVFRTHGHGVNEVQADRSATPTPSNN
jgi:hypothetical protein